MAESSSNGRRLTPEDIYNIKLIADAQISPDGSQVAYVQTILDKEKNDYRASIYLVSTGGGKPRRYTSAAAKDTSPRWSPNGETIAFLSNRSGSNQLWTISAAGGEASQLTDLREGINGFSWSPDGSTIAFASKVTAEQIERQKKGEDEPKDESDVVRITKIRFRSNGNPGFIDNKPVHVWCVAATGGDPWQVTTGDYVDGRPRWSPSGQEIVFGSNRTEDREYNSASEIWAVNARGGEPRGIATGDDAHFHGAVPAPDGKTVAYAGFRHPEGGPELTTLWVDSMAGGEAKSLTDSLDRNVGEGVTGDTSSGSDPDLAWTPDGKGIYFKLGDRGNSHLYRIDAAGGDSKLILGGRRAIKDFTLSADGSKIAYVNCTTTNPSDVFVCSADGSNETQLTSANAEFFSSVAISEPEEITFQSNAEDKAEIHGWIMKPIGYQEGQRYPMVLEIHGGPHGQYGNVYFNEFQLLAAQGYVVVFTNPRGSTGYGNAFTKATIGAWGDVDLPDQMAAVDWAIEQGYADPNRLGVTGGSYGGFMTNWVVGHTDRFKAAVTQRCVSNLYSFYGTSDIGFHFGEREVGDKKPWEDRDAYEKMSPITYMKNVTTPLLIIHSEQDYRCPIEQAEQVFVQLKRLGKEVEFVRFPNENHELSRGGQPKHRVERLQYILGWFASHL